MRACHQKVSEAEAAKAGCPPLVRRAGVQVRRRARRAGGRVQFGVNQRVNRVREPACESRRRITALPAVTF